jgi:hypothetical protein
MFNSKVLLHEPRSNDLVLLNSNLEFENKYTGAQKCDFRKNSKNPNKKKAQTHLRNPHHTSEDNTMIWFCGTKTLRVVDLSSMTILNQIDEFFPFFNDQEFGIGLRAVSKNQGNNILTTFVISNVYSFMYYEPGLELDPKLGETVLPTCKLLLNL